MTTKHEMVLSDIAVPAVVGLMFSSGLVPSVMVANKQALSLLNEQQGSGPADTDTPPLKLAWLLGYRNPPRIADVLATVGRLPATGASSALLTDPKRKLLRKTEFGAALAELPAPSWPLDSATGAPVGGEALQRELGPTLRSRQLSPVALDACWVALSGASPFVSREEIDRQLSRWRPETDELALAAFETSLIQGRANILLGYVVLFGLQALVLGVLMLGPLADAVRDNI